MLPTKAPFLLRRGLKGEKKSFLQSYKDTEFIEIQFAAGKAIAKTTERGPKLPDLLEAPAQNV